MKLALIAVLAFAIAVSASYPRLVTLGGDARLMISDYVEMWAYPGTISGYQFVTGQSDSPQSVGDGWFGMVRDFDGTTMGATINHGNNLEFLVHPGSWGLIVGVTYDKTTVDSVTNVKTTGFDANWGTDVGLFGDYSDLAIGFGYNKVATTMSDVSTGPSDLTVGASVRGHQDSFFNLFPIISADLTMHTVDDGIDSTANEKTTDIAFDLGAHTNEKLLDRFNIDQIRNIVKSVCTGRQQGRSQDGQSGIFCAADLNISVQGPAPVDDYFIQITFSLP